MNLHKVLATNSACYKANQKITGNPKGIVVHSTGAPNATLKRYVGPNDGLLGENPNKNYFNSSVSQVCPHAVIGKLADGSVATYQILEWNQICWCSGAGTKTLASSNGFSLNNANFLGYIQFEIAEDGSTTGSPAYDKSYCDAVYKESVELCAYLVKTYGIPVTNKTLIDHNEGRLLGICSSHYDVSHWFPKFGYSMDKFRADVIALAENNIPVTTPSTTTTSTTKKTVTLPVIVKVTDGPLNIRDSYSFTSKVNGVIQTGSSYTIVETKVNGSETWGKLKSGAGWIALSYTNYGK